MREKGAEQAIGIEPIGRVEASGGATVLRIFPAYRDGMRGLDGFSHIWVLYWFHENDSPAARSVLRVHPRKDPRNPLTGVFATRSPMRPNLIALSLCRVEGVEESEGTIRVEPFEARPGSPVLDIKPYLPSLDRPEEARVPVWARNLGAARSPRPVEARRADEAAAEGPGADGEVGDVPAPSKGSKS